MPRTIVVSDPHGQVAIVRRALDHAGFDKARDRLILSGDFVDSGLGGFDCLELADEMGAELLLGNHEHAFYCRSFIDEGRADEQLQSVVRRRVQEGEIQLAALVDDAVVVTHAGVSSAYQQVFDEELASDPARLVDWLNTVFAEDVRDSCDAWEEGEHGLFGPDGPLWFRAYDPAEILRGIVQVAGHTPPELYGSLTAPRQFMEAGFNLIDPFARGWIYDGCPGEAPLRYAAIEDGRVAVVQG